MRLEGFAKCRRAIISATVVMLLPLGIVLAAGTAGATTCLDCDPGGGGGGNDTTAPTVTGVSPANGASNVAPTANVTVTFSEEMESASITSSTFTLVRQGQTTPVAATVSYDVGSKTATLDPDADLAQKASYTATVKGGAGGVTDLSGNPLAADHTWSFSVADIAPPTVALTSPTKDAHVRGTVRIGATATDNIGISHVAFRVQGGVWSQYDYSAPYEMTWDSTQSQDGSATLQAIAYDTSLNSSSNSYSFVVDNTAPVVNITSGPSGTVSSSTATFEFSATDAQRLHWLECRLAEESDADYWKDCGSPMTYTDLADGFHTFEVRGTDLAGNSTTAVRNWTVDTTAPSGTIKINNGAAYTTSAEVNLSLSASGSGSGLSSMRFRNEDAQTWSAWEPYATTRQWTLSSADGSKSVYVQYKDEAGNASAAARDIIKLDTTAPSVRRVVPAENATDIAPRANVYAFFSEAMRTGSINTNTVKLYKVGSTTALPATVTYDATTKKAILNPDANLQRGARYKAMVTSGTRDLVDNPLDQNSTVAGNQPKKWFFTVRN